MGRLANAVALRKDPEWREWLVTAAAYVSREVYLEASTVTDHAVRYRLALDVMVTPEVVAAQLVTIISTDPDVAVKGTSPAAVTEELTITKVQAIWTKLALLHYSRENEQGGTT